MTPELEKEIILALRATTKALENLAELVDNPLKTKVLDRIVSANKQTLNRCESEHLVDEWRRGV